MAQLTDDEKMQMIELVRERPPIWDVTNEGHKNHAKIAHEWEQIAGLMNGKGKNLSGADLKKVWRSMIIYFHQLLNKGPTGDSGDHTAIKWPFYEPLLFTLGQKDNLSTLRISNVEQKQVLDEEASQASIASSSTASSTPTAPPPAKKPRLEQTGMTKKDEQRRTGKIEQMLADALKKDEEDDESELLGKKVAVIHRRLAWEIGEDVADDFEESISAIIRQFKMDYFHASMY